MSNYPFNNESRPERPSSDEAVILAAAAVVAREKAGVAAGYPHSSLKNQVYFTHLEWCAIENHQDPFYVVYWHFSRHPERC